MKKFLSLLMIGLMLSISTAFAKSDESLAQQRAEIRHMAAETLDRLYQKYPNARRVIQNCYAYATLSNSGVKILLFGSSHGRGLAVNNQTREEVFMRMKEVSGGLGLGAKEYDLVFVFDNKDAWDSFIVGKTRFGSSASASASDGVKGGSIEGADIAAEGTWIYQMTTKGLTLEATLKGTKFFKDKKLNNFSEE